MYVRAMKRSITLALAALMLAIPATADASYYVNRPGAEHYLRNLLHHYGYTNTSVYCRPKKGQNESVVKSGVVLWHKWYCGYIEGYAGASCKGTVSILGSDSGAGYYYYRHDSVGEDC